MLEEIDGGTSRFQALSALRNSNFRWFWLNGATQAMAQGMQFLAMGILVLDVTDSSHQLGWVIFAYGVPTFLFTLAGGIVADHSNRIKLLISTRVAVMYLGRIVEIAESSVLYNNPQHPYTRALLSAVPIPDPRVQKQRTVLVGDVPSPANIPPGCPFHPRCPEREDACTRIVPDLMDIDGDHSVACILRTSQATDT